MLDYGAALAAQILASKSSKPAASDSAIVIELLGDVGAGKTTLTRGLARGLGIKTPVTSPSFTLSKAYALPGGSHLVHYDFYRLNDPGLMCEDLSDQLADPANIIVIEWGDSVKDLLPPQHLTLRLTLQDDGTREVAEL